MWPRARRPEYRSPLPSPALLRSRINGGRTVTLRGRDQRNAYVQHRANECRRCVRCGTNGVGSVTSVATVVASPGGAGNLDSKRRKMRLAPPSPYRRRQRHGSLTYQWQERGQPQRRYERLVPIQCAGTDPAASTWSFQPAARSRVQRRCPQPGQRWPGSQCGLPFTITGAAPKSVLIRAAGSALVPFTLAAPSPIRSLR